MGGGGGGYMHVAHSHQLTNNELVNVKYPTSCTGIPYRAISV